MATSKTDIQVVNPNLRIWDIIFAADADVTLAITHGMAGTPAMYILCPLLPAFYLNSLHVSAVTGTTITITGANVGSSGVGGAQARLVLMTPHSVMQ